MVTLYDLFRAMQASYGDGNLVGWRAAYFSPEENGLRVICLLKETEKIALITFRGTVFSRPENLRDDLILAFKQIPLAFQNACHIDQHIRKEIIPDGYHIVYLGHSLGAIHASLLACLHKGHAVTYESPGIAALLQQNEHLTRGAQHSQTQIVNFFAAPNFINTLHRPIGSSYRVYLGLNSGMSTSHVLKCVAAAIFQTTAQAPIASGSTISRWLQVADYAIWLSRQHSIDSAVAELTTQASQFIQLGKVESWPETGLELIQVTNLAALEQCAISTASASEGLHALSSQREIGILEERLQQLPDYRVTRLTAHDAREEQANILTRILSTTNSVNAQPTSQEIRRVSESLQIYVTTLTQNISQPIVNHGIQPYHQRSNIMLKKTNTSNVPLPAPEAAAAIQPLPVVTHDPNLEEQAWCSTSRRFLGYRYDKAILQETNRLQEQAFQITDAEIEIRNLRTIKIQAVELTKNAAQESLHRTFSAHSYFPVQKIFLGSDVDVERTATGYQASREIVCSFFHFKEAQAALRQIPTTTASAPFDYVFSGQMYVGYQIDFVIRTEEQVAHTDASTSAGAQANLGDIAKFSASGSSLFETLSGKQIAQVTVNTHGLGGYTLPDVSFQVKTLADINQALQQVEQHFNQNLPRLNNRGFVIEGYEAVGHVRRYIPEVALPTATHPLLQDNRDDGSIAVAAESRMPTTALSAQMLDNLARAISENLSNEEKGVFGNKISLSIMLQRIQEIFPNVITQLRKPLSTGPAIVVMGKTGAGKSTLIGYQLGYDLTWNEQDRLDYAHSDASLDRPIIGHTGNSQTKGGSLYTRQGTPFLYLDSAGIFDTAGLEANLCNGIALSSIIRKIESQLTTLIIVLPSSAITQERASGFLELIDQLRKCLQNPLNPDIWSNMVFAINDQWPMVDRRGRPLSPHDCHQKLITDINDTIAALVKECNELLPEQSLLTWLKGNTYSSIEEALIKRAAPFARENSDRGRRLTEYLVKIRALSAVLENPDNLIVANLSEPDTRQAISQLIRMRRPCSLGHHFTPANFYQDSPLLKFNTLLCATASYYNQLSIQKADYMTGVEKIRQQLQKNQGELGRKSDLLQKRVTPEDAREKIDAAIKENQIALDKSKRTLRETEEKLKLEVGELRADGKRSEIATEEGKIVELKKDNTPIVLDDPIRPKTPIMPRSWWTWSDAWATQYEFEYGDNLSYLSVTEEGPGKFTELEGNSKSQGVYKAQYLPKWHNWESDCGAQLRVYVAKKDHPTTKASIRELETTLEGLRKKEREFKTQIEGLESKCIKCETELQRLAKSVATLESATTAQEKLQQSIILLDERKKELTQALQVEEEKLSVISEKLARYQPFFCLIADIIAEYRLKNELIATEREILVRFLERIRVDAPVRPATVFTSVSAPVGSSEPARQMTWLAPGSSSGIHGTMPAANELGEAPEFPAANDDVTRFRMGGGAGSRDK